MKRVLWRLGELREALTGLEASQLLLQIVIRGDVIAPFQPLFDRSHFPQLGFVEGAIRWVRVTFEDCISFRL